MFFNFNTEVEIKFVKLFLNIILVRCYVLIVGSTLFTW